MRRRFEVVQELLKRDLASRWRGSVLGGGWALLQPLGWMVLYFLVFSLVLRIPPPRDAAAFGFGIYLLSGLVPFLALQEGIVRSSSIWMENANLLRKTTVPPSSFVVTVCLSAVALEIIAIAVLLIYESTRGLLDVRRLHWLVAGLAAQLLLTLVFAFVAAILAAFIRDTLLVLPFLMACLFYLTPVVYPRELAPAELLLVLDANPVAWVLQCFRAALAGGPPPVVSTAAVGFILLVMIAALLARLADRLRAHLADVL